MKPAKDQAKIFAEWLKDSLLSAGMRPIDLANTKALSKQAISQIVNQKPHPDTGKLILPRRETVVRIAKALGKSEQEALDAAGYKISGMNSSPEEIDPPELAALFYQSNSLFPEITEEDREEMKALFKAARARLLQMAQEQKQKKPKK